MAGLWIYLLGLLLCFDYTVANHLSRNRTLTRDQLMRRRTTLSGIPNGNNAAPQMGRGPLSGGRAGTPPGGGLTDPRTGATGLSQRDIDRVILTPVQDGAVRSLRNMLSTRRGRGNPRLIGFLIPRRDGRTQLRLMRDNSGNRVNVNELPFNIRTIVAAARRANLLPSRNGTRVRNRTPPIVVLRSPNQGFQQSRRIATVGGFAGQGGGPNAQPNADSADSGGGETIKQRTVNIEVNVQSPDAPATGATPQGQNPNAANPGMMNPALMNNQQSRFMNNMGPGAGFNPMFNEIQQPGMNSRNGFNGFNRPGPVNNNNNRNNNRPADDSSSSSKSSNSGGGNINIGLGIGVGSSSPVVPPKPASTRTPASPQFGGGRGTMNGAQNVQPTPPDPFQQQRGINAFDQSGFPGMPQTGFPPNDQSGFPSNTQISFPSNPQTGFPPSNQFQPNANNPQAPTLQRFDQQPPAISGSMPASNSMPWNTFQSNAGNFGQDTVLTSQTSPGGIGSAAGAGGFDPTLQNTNLPNSGNAFQQGSFASEPTIGEPMIIDNGGRTTVVVDNITFTGLLPPGPPVLKTQVINGKGSVHINPLVSSERAANSFGRNFPPQLHFTNPNDINSINQNILMNANSNQLFQNQNILGLPGTQAMTPNVNVPVRQPGGVPVFPMM
ncbi:myb-like protein I isoform X3 [Crassostrea angulata]|uniref:myb-like protein I isoform X3 n=1 Tax=Magallana angulata TaxID=2784310 RepID=UPI0022B142DF|nr:myb-like protein I isoform X3 [Crassostrea angulata]